MLLKAKDKSLKSAKEKWFIIYRETKTIKIRTYTDFWLRNYGSLKTVEPNILTAKEGGAGGSKNKKEKNLSTKNSGIQQNYSLQLWVKRGRFLTENNLSRADVTVRNAKKKKKSSLVWMAITLDGHLNVQEEIKPETVTVWVHYSHVPHPLIQPRVGWKHSGKKTSIKSPKAKLEFVIHWPPFT